MLMRPEVRGRAQLSIDVEQVLVLYVKNEKSVRYSVSVLQNTAVSVSVFVIHTKLTK
jgi:hypothetical protein